MGRQGGTTDPGCWFVLGEVCIWLGRQSSCSWPSLPHCGKGWVRLFTPDPPLLVHPAQERLHPWLPAATDWFSIPLHSSLYQSEVAALVMGCWGHQSWSLRVWCNTSLAAFLHPLCPRGSCSDTFSLLQQQSRVLKGCILSWDCIFALPTVFCHLNVSQEITLWA